jgi:uncharacterized damage-inducible protein DinB
MNTTLVRLRTQLDVLPLLLGSATEASLRQRPAPGKWSALENLAHLARYHEVFMERLRRIMAEDSPPLGRYRAEEDPGWPPWQQKPLPEVLASLTRLRGELVQQVESLSEGDLTRACVHPVMGAMPVPLLLEFFLLHEGHHLYTVMRMVKR